MRMGQGVNTGLGHGGITCVLQTQFSSFQICHYSSRKTLSTRYLENHLSLDSDIWHIV